jgi:hypothetical protein
MKHENLFEKKRKCEITIEKIRFEIQQMESYPTSPINQKKLDRLDTELSLEYEALEYYKNLISNLENN